MTTASISDDERKVLERFGIHTAVYRKFYIARLETGLKLPPFYSSSDLLPWQLEQIDLNEVYAVAFTSEVVDGEIRVKPSSRKLAYMDAKKLIEENGSDKTH